MTHDAFSVPMLVYNCEATGMRAVPTPSDDETLPGGCYVMWLQPGGLIRQAPEAGWYVVHLDDDGLCYDAAGTYDTPQEAFEHVRPRL